MAAASEREGWKRMAAEAAAALVEDGMAVGLGSGSTAALMLEALAARVARGLRFVGIPSSEATATLARRLGLPLASLAEHRRLDIAIDGADEVERGSLNLIKGRGGALLREKIVAAATRRFVIVVDEGKLVDRLGATPLPVEILPFGAELALDRLIEMGAKPRFRMKGPDRFVTDNGNYVADCDFGPIADPPGLDQDLAAIPGILGTGLFIAMASEVIVGGAAALRRLKP
jgi:ribose 5-phosphate isomerase A